MPAICIRAGYHTGVRSWDDQSHERPVRKTSMARSAGGMPARSTANSLAPPAQNMPLPFHMETLMKDVAYACRTLKNPYGFPAVAVATIGLGIGACTATFSVVHAVLLRPLPYSDPERLALVWSDLRARNVPDFPFPIP